MYIVSKIQKHLNQLKGREFFVVRQRIVPVTMDNSRSFFWRIEIMRKKIELSEQRFGRLIVVCEAGRTKQRGLLWECLCDCGERVIVSSGNLRSGNTKSCGCLMKEIARNIGCIKKHGMAKMAVYKIWSGIIQRCTNKNNAHYENYGSRGITVCERWLKFENFFEDMGERPNDLTIERKNNDKGYCKENCKWATRTEQARNSRVSKNNTTGINGVGFCKSSQKYTARITVNNKKISLGYFKELKNAISAREAGELKYWNKK